MDLIYWVIWIAVGVVSIILLFMWFIDKKMYKHKVRVIDYTEGNGIELDFKARDHVRDGVNYWQLNKERNKELKNAPVPPADAINIAKKGVKSAMAVRTPTGEYIWVKRNIQLNYPVIEIPAKLQQLADPKERDRLISLYKEQKLAEWKEKNKAIVLEGCHEPLSTKQRMVLMHNYNKAVSRKGFSLKEHIPQMVAWGIIGLIIIGLMVFWGDIAQPAINSKELTKQIVDEQKIIVQILQDIKQGQQRVADAGGG